MMPYGTDFYTYKCIICGAIYWAEYWKGAGLCPHCQRLDNEKQLHNNIQPIVPPSSFYFRDLDKFFG